MFPELQQRLGDLKFKVIENFPIQPSQQLHHLQCKFERRTLKANVPPWRRHEHEAEVHMNDVPLAVDQNVSVVSVFYVQ